MPRQFELEKISCEEVARAYLARIEEAIPKLNAVVQLWLERALIEARNGDKAIARNELTGPLHGVPITIKDNLDTGGRHQYRRNGGPVTMVARARTLARARAAAPLTEAKLS